MIFYTPEINNYRCFLNEVESMHAVKALRLKTGDEIALIDGRGGFYKAVIVDPHPKSCELKVVEQQLQYGKRQYRLHIGIAPTKNIARFEWFVEKAVEIGIDEITPLLCERSERKTLSSERLLRIMIAAMKQSKKAYLPQLNEVLSFNDWLKNIACEKTENAQRYIAHCNNASHSKDARELLKDVYKSGHNTTIAIGPEGDFSMQEVELANSHGLSCISLGTSILRTETAGVAACHSIYFMNN